MKYVLLRTESYIDSEGDEAARHYYRGEDGKQYVTGPGYFMLPVDDDGNLILPGAEAAVRIVNCTITHDAADAQHATNHILDWSGNHEDWEAGRKSIEGLFDKGKRPW